MLFPLAVNPFERYYLADDRPEYPTAFVVELRFSGVLDRAAFASALAQAVARHPLLSAVVADGRRGLEWVAVRSEAPAVDWADQSIAITPLGGEFIDLRERSGMRVWVRTSQSATRVVLQFHHACCDGLASIAFVDELLSLYAAAVQGTSSAPALPTHDLEQLRDRGLLERPNLTPWIAVRDVFVTAQVWARILLRRAARLAAPRTRDAAALGEPFEFQSESLTRGETDSYQKVAAAQGVPANDLLLRDLLLAVDDWNRAQDTTPRGRLSVNVPVSIRAREGKVGPASNKLGFAFVAAKQSAVRDRAALLREVHRQTDEIKRRKLALYFLGGLAAASNFGPVVRLMLRSNKTFATIVLSNVGQMFAASPLAGPDGRMVCGNVVLESFTGVPPTRPHTRAAIAVVQYAGATAISLRCDPKFFDRAATREFLQTYIRRVRETISRGD